MRKQLALILGLSAGLNAISTTAFAQSPPGTAAVNTLVANNSSTSRNLLSSACSATGFTAPLTLDPLPAGSADSTWCGADTFGTGAISYDDCTVNYGWRPSFLFPGSAEAFVSTSGDCTAQVLTSPNPSGLQIIEVRLTN